MIGVISMGKTVKPRVSLDSRMLGEINKFYSSKLGEDLLGRECFSDPIMELHICNIKAPLEGGGKCEYCKHIAGRRCYITCHIHQFCLMAYAYRLGIGEPGEDVEDLWPVIKYHSSKMSYNRLYGAVTKVLAEEKIAECGVVQDIRAVKIKDLTDTSKLSVPITSSVPESDEVAVKKVPSSDEEESEYLSIVEAAKLYGCSYGNLANHIKKGNLKSEMVEGKKVLKREDILNFKPVRGRKKRDVVLPVPEESSDNTDECKSSVEGQKMSEQDQAALRSLPALLPPLPALSSLPSLPSSSLPEASEYLSIAEAAKLYGCSYGNLANHVKKGNLISLEVEGKKVLKREDILNFKPVRGRKKRDSNEE